MPQLQELTGMKFDDYRKWLQHSKRQHNVTNLFLYMEDAMKRR